MAKKYINMISFKSTKKAQKILEVMAKLVGASSASAFMRDMTESICSGDNKKLQTFLEKVFKAGVVLEQKRLEAQQTQLRIQEVSKKK